MIMLGEQEPFAVGSTRRCYVHPRDGDVCLKIAVAGAVVRRRQKSGLFSRWRWLPDSFCESNLNEWRGYRRAEKMRDEKVWTHIPRCYGFVKTDKGDGLAVQLLRDGDGKIAATLAHRLSVDGGKSLRAVFDEFCRFMQNSGFYTRSLHNVICVKKADGDGLYLAEPRHRILAESLPSFLRRRFLSFSVGVLRKKFFAQPSESAAESSDAR